MGNSNQRDTRFEILRVLSMLFIVLAHFLQWGTLTNSSGSVHVSFGNGYILNSLIFPFAHAISSLGVICFVMITGYFMCERTTLRFDSIVKTWMTTAFYSVTLALMASSCLDLSGRDIISSFFPIGTDKYWFVTKYIALVTIAPFLAMVITNLDKAGLRAMLVAVAALTVTITHGIPYGNRFFGDSPLSVATFILIFCIAAYEKRVGFHPFIQRNAGWIFLISILFQGSVGVLINYLRIKDGVVYGGFSAGYNALSIVPGTALFLWAKKHSFTDSWTNRMLSRIAPMSFAVYLIHDNPYIRKILWNDIINPGMFWDRPVWLFFLFITPVAVYLVCAAADMVRLCIFKVLRVDRLTTRIARLNITLGGRTTER